MKTDRVPFSGGKRAGRGGLVGARVAFAVAALLLALSAAGCGYRFGETKSRLSRQVKRLAIPVFVNETDIFALEEVFTGSARRTFADGGAFRLVPASEADYRLLGRIVRAEDAVSTRRRATGGPHAATREISVRLEVSLVDAGGFVFRKAGLSDRGGAFGAETYADHLENRDDRLRRLADDMTQRAYNELAEGF